MTRPEFVGNRVRITIARLRGETPLEWPYLQPSEQSYWRRIGQASIDAEASYTSMSVNVIR